MQRSLAVIALCACSSSPITSNDAAPDAAAAEPGVVATDRGAVRGVREGDVFAWRGIPYAAPPIGALRWQVPQPMPAWTGVRDAVSWAQSCIEITTGGQLMGGGEDCLHLNVWSRADATAPLPVLVFIHGGFSLNGSSSHVSGGDRLYDGAYIAAHGPAVVVTLNYRLGALGFFTAPGVAGNAALHDQLAALHWVHDNIAAFGGDPSHVLVFGESAGGAATCALYASPKAAGLFSAALVESGGCGAKTAARADLLSASLVHATGCDTAADPLACLRALPADRVATAAPIDLGSGTDRWSTSIDGDIVPEAPGTAIAAGRQNHVPLIIGNTSNEYSTLIAHFLGAPIATDGDYRAAVARFFPQGAPQILAQYPSSAFASPLQALITLMTDAEMLCPARRALRAAAASQTEPVRRYEFTHTYSNSSLQSLGAGHSLDLPFEFGNLALDGFVPSPRERALADAIIGYWTRFAATGDPDGAGAATWPVYDAAADTTLVLDEEITTVDGIRTPQCDFWDRP